MIRGSNLSRLLPDHLYEKGHFKIVGHEEVIRIGGMIFVKDQYKFFGIRFGRYVSGKLSHLINVQIGLLVNLS